MWQEWAEANPSTENLRWVDEYKEVFRSLNSLPSNLKFWKASNSDIYLTLSQDQQSTTVPLVYVHCTRWSHSEHRAPGHMSPPYLAFIDQENMTDPLPVRMDTLSSISTGAQDLISSMDPVVTISWQMTVLVRLANTVTKFMVLISLALLRVNNLSKRLVWLWSNKPKTHKKLFKKLTNNKSSNNSFFKAFIIILTLDIFTNQL